MSWNGPPLMVNWSLVSSTMLTSEWNYSPLALPTRPSVTPNVAARAGWVTAYLRQLDPFGLKLATFVTSTCAQAEKPSALRTDAPRCVRAYSRRNTLHQSTGEDPSTLAAGGGAVLLLGPPGRHGARPLSLSGAGVPLCRLNA